MERASTRVNDGLVQGFLTKPDSPPSGGIVLTHGAGGNCEMPLLRAAADAFAGAGVAVLSLRLDRRDALRQAVPNCETLAL